MRRLYGLLIILAFSFTTASSVLAYSVVGIVTDQNRNYVNDAFVTVTDSQGMDVGTGKTDLYGRYCIPVKKTGKYTLSFDPGKTDYQGGSSVETVDVEGLTVDWHVSPLQPAKGTSNLGVASAATATCGAAYWSTATAAALGVLGVGGLVGGVIGATSGGGGGGGPTPASGAQ
jgi:hypothetical protein